MNDRKLMRLINLLFFFSLIGGATGLQYLMIIIWIIALALLFQRNNYKVMKIFYLVCILLLLFLLIFLHFRTQE